MITVTIRYVTWQLFFLSLIPPVVAAQPAAESTAVIYYNEACSMCAAYLKAEMIPTLKGAGIRRIVMKDYVNEKPNRLQLNQLNKEHKIPPFLQSHFVVSIQNRIILGGHIPKHIIVDLLTKNFYFDKILVVQDKMDKAKTYQAWGFKGDAREYDIETPISGYLDWFKENQGSLKGPGSDDGGSWDMATMLPLVISTGFLDGINPCAIAVLLLFIAFLYTIRKTKTHILKMGASYILAIYLAYFLIGIGLVKAIVLTGYPHFAATLGAYLLIALGILNISSYLFANMKFEIGIPSFSKEYLKQWMYRATVPATFILGFLVGLCTFPCSGGMYVAIVGLLAAKADYTQGLVYLMVYNFMFVLPLVII
ncbi:MAG: hypothetical protein Q8Q33_03110, partial [Chlamydiota bacterium]|nr:hypothetical protein [Chlamydiota bacterium]